MNCPYRMVSNLTDLNPSVGFNVGAIHSQENDNFVGVVPPCRPSSSAFCMCLRARAGTLGTAPTRE